MEEYISGFIELHDNLSFVNIANALNQKYSVVIDTIEKLGEHNQLNLYPENCLPRDNFFCFLYW